MFYLEARKNRSRLLTSSEIKYIGRGEAAATPENRLPPLLRDAAAPCGQADEASRDSACVPASAVRACAAAWSRTQCGAHSHGAR